MNKHPKDPQIASCLEISPASEACADEIEQRIIRGYIRLVFGCEKTVGVRTATVMRLGPLEFRLTESLEDDSNLGMPLYWLEVVLKPHQLTVDRYRMSEFDDGELAGAVEFIRGAASRSEGQGVSPPVFGRSG